MPRVRRIGDQRVHRLARIWRERRDVDERCHVRIVARLGDHCSAVGMADEDDRLDLRVDHAPDRFDVTFERQRRVLHDADAVVVLLQEAVDLLPSGAVDEAPVHENDGTFSPHDDLLRKGMPRPGILRNRAKRLVNPISPGRCWPTCRRLPNRRRPPGRGARSALSPPARVDERAHVRRGDERAQGMNGS